MVSCSIYFLEVILIVFFFKIQTYSIFQFVFLPLEFGAFSWYSNTFTMSRQIAVRILEDKKLIEPWMFLNLSKCISPYTYKTILLTLIFK